MLYIQGTLDVAHPRPNLDSFVAAYRKAGGRVDLHLYEGEGEGFILHKPDTPAAMDGLDRIIGFLHRECQPGRVAA